MKVLSLGFLFLALMAGQIAEAKNGYYPTRFANANVFANFDKKAGAQKLVYYGGPVIGNAKTYVVYWGPNVNADAKAGLADFFTQLTKSNLMSFMDQYNTLGKAQDGRDGTGQHIGNGSYAGTYTITPVFTNTTIDDTDIQKELQGQIDAGKLPKPDADTLYMVYFPPGTTITSAGMQSCAQFCAYHGFKGDAKGDHFYYGVMPDLGGACSFGCGFDSYFNNLTAVSSHEFCESVTDPFPTPGNTPAYPQAWNTTDGSEIGDLCAGNNNTLKGSNGKTYTVQAEFDNASAACTSTTTWQAQ
jgi:hypothetical protein